MFFFEVMDRHTVLLLEVLLDLKIHVCGFTILCGLMLCCAKYLINSC